MSEIPNINNSYVNTCEYTYDNKLIDYNKELLSIYEKEIFYLNNGNILKLTHDCKNSLTILTIIKNNVITNIEYNTLYWTMSKYQNKVVLSSNNDQCETNKIIIYDENMNVLSEKSNNFYIDAFVTYQNNLYALKYSHTDKKMDTVLININDENQIITSIYEGNNILYYCNMGGNVVDINDPNDKTYKIPYTTGLGIGINEKYFITRNYISKIYHKKDYGQQFQVLVHETNAQIMFSYNNTYHCIEHSHEPTYIIFQYIEDTNELKMVYYHKHIFISELLTIMYSKINL